MLTPSKPSNSGNSGNGNSDTRRPRISLLQDEHWAYIGKLYCMSPRELQVARLVCEGLNNEEIAGNLNIKQGTIKTHIRNIYRRIRVRNKIEMLLKFVEHAAQSPASLKIDPSCRLGSEGSLLRGQ